MFSYEYFYFTHKWADIRLLPTISTKRIRSLRPHEKHHRVTRPPRPPYLPYSASVPHAEASAAAPRARHRRRKLPGDRAARARPPGGRGDPQGAEWASAASGPVPCRHVGRGHHRSAAGATGPAQASRGRGCGCGGHAKRRRRDGPARWAGERVPAVNGRVARRCGTKAFRATLLASALLDST